MMYEHIVILAHGSRREEANQEMQALGQLVQKVHPTWQVTVAFAEFATPTLEEALEELFLQGKRSVIVVPMFLTVGNHLHKGLPQRIDAFCEKKAMKVTMAQHIGADPILVQLVEKRIAEAE